jgi:autophagy-related protein 11
VSGHDIAPGESSDPSQVRTLEDAKQALERELQNERGSRETEVAELSMRNEQLRLAVERSRAAEKGVSSKLVDLQTEKLRIEGELQTLRTRLADVEQDKQQAKQQLSDTSDELLDVRRQLQVEQSAARDNRVELADRLLALRKMTAELEAKEEERKDQVAEARTSLEQQIASSVAEVDEARSRQHELEVTCKELEDQLARARSEAKNTLKDIEARQQQLYDAIGEKDKLLRDHRSEAELDRAVLERELEELRGQLGMAQDDVASGRARVKQVESELEDVTLDVSRRDEELQSQRKEADAAWREADGLRRGAMTTATRSVRLAKSLHDAQRETIASLSTDMPEGACVSGALDDPDWAALDLAALEALIDTLSAPLTPGLGEAVKSKIETLTTTVKKWQKECKAYRERAQRATAASFEKIAFRKCV